MHPYEMKIMDFMQKVATQSVAISDELLQPAVRDITHYLRKMMEEDPNRDFTLRMSNIGRPLCQLKMAKAEAPALQDEWNNPLRMFFGGVIEATAICVLKAAGINIEEEQTAVTLEVPYNQDIVNGRAGKPRFGMERRTIINGTLDLVIDGKVWDVKSSSAYMFEHKFGSYQTLKENDEFGYMAQMFGYAKARGIPAGGWIVVDKSSGIIKIIEVPADQHDADMEQQLTAIRRTVTAILMNEPFERCFVAVDEKFKKRYTGAQYLESPCIFCKFRYGCWPGLQYLPNQSSTAFEKPYKFYTKLPESNLSNENTISQGQRPEATATSGAEDTGEVPVTD